MEMFTILHGSHLYGLNTPSSDLDYKSVYLPTVKQLYIGKFEPNVSLNTKSSSVKAKNTVDDVDHTIYSLHEFFRLLAKGEMVTIDMLHANSATSLSPRMLRLFNDIQSQAHLFHCKQMKSFMGYVRSQAAKYGIKGSRLAFAKQLQNILELNRPVKDSKLSEFKDILPENEYARKLDTGYELFGALYQWTGWYSSVESKCQRMISEYGHRAQLAEKNEGVDWKALSHSLRAAYQLQSIFTEGKIVFPFHGTQHKILMDVKAGRLPYREVAELIENEMLATEYMSANSSLQEEVDQSKIDEFLYELIVKYAI